MTTTLGVYHVSAVKSGMTRGSFFILVFLWVMAAFSLTLPNSINCPALLCAVLFCSASCSNDRITITRDSYFRQGIFACQPGCLLFSLSQFVILSLSFILVFFSLVYVTQDILSLILSWKTADQLWETLGVICLENRKCQRKAETKGFNVDMETYFFLLCAFVPAVPAQRKKGSTRLLSSFTWGKLASLGFLHIAGSWVSCQCSVFKMVGNVVFFLCQQLLMWWPWAI